MSEVAAYNRQCAINQVLAGEGNFSCHHTAYNARNGADRPVYDWKQCKGATKYYRRFLRVTRQAERI